MFSAILAVIKAIPWFQDRFDEFMAWYFQQQVDKIKADIISGIRKAIEDHDQRDLEKAIGNPNAGEPSGIPGTSIVDHLPVGVHPQASDLRQPLE